MPKPMTAHFWHTLLGESMPQHKNGRTSSTGLKPVAPVRQNLVEKGQKHIWLLDPEKHVQDGVYELEYRPSELVVLKADKPKADKPKADKPKADKPKADKPKADKPKAENLVYGPGWVSYPGWVAYKTFTKVHK